MGFEQVYVKKKKEENSIYCINTDNEVVDNPSEWKKEPSEVIL